MATKPKAVFCIGDTPYVTIGFSVYGTTTQLDKDSTQADFADHLEQFARHPFMKSLFASSALVYNVTDDHNWGGNDWDHSIVQADDGVQSIGTSGTDAEKQAQVNLHWKRGRDAFIADVIANYDNPDMLSITAVDADRPDNALLFTQDPDAADYSPLYWKQGFDLSGNAVAGSGHLEVFTIDCMSCMDALGKIDDANKTRIGVSQLAQFKADLLASTATFKMIVSSKNTYGVTGGSNNDDWDTYSTERDEILAYLDTNSITGVFWLSGDQHINHVEVQNTTDHTYDHVLFCPCPIGQGYNSVTPTVNNQTIWWDKQQVYGLISVYDDYVDLAICNAATGKVLIRGSVLAGSNGWTVRDIPVAI